MTTPAITVSYDSSRAMSTVIMTSAPRLLPQELARLALPQRRKPQRLRLGRLQFVKNRAPAFDAWRPRSP